MIYNEQQCNQNQRIVYFFPTLHKEEPLYSDYFVMVLGK